VSIYDNIAIFYEKWSSGDVAYKDTKTFYLNVLNQLNSGKYLEIGIGTGRISFAAIRDNPISVIGIDSSEKMIDYCKEKYLNNSWCGTLELILGNVLEMTYENTFDGVIMPFRTIGHILNDNDLQILFERVFHALKASGWFLLDHYMFNRQWAEEHNNVPIVMYQDDEVTIEDIYNYFFEREYMHSMVLVNDIEFESFDFRWISPKKIKNYAQKTGFEVYSLMGEFDGTPWNESSFEQIWCLRKPGHINSLMPEFKCELK